MTSFVVCIATLHPMPPPSSAGTAGQLRMRLNAFLFTQAALRAGQRSPIALQLVVKHSLAPLRADAELVALVALDSEESFQALQEQQRGHQGVAQAAAQDAPLSNQKRKGKAGSAAGAQMNSVDGDNAATSAEPVATMTPVSSDVSNPPSNPDDDTDEAPAAGVGLDGGSGGTPQNIDGKQKKKNKKKKKKSNHATATAQPTGNAAALGTELKGPISPTTVSDASQATPTQLEPEPHPDILPDGLSDSLPGHGHELTSTGLSADGHQSLPAASVSADLQQQQCEAKVMLIDGAHQSLSLSLSLSL